MIVRLTSLCVTLALLSFCGSLVQAAERGYREGELLIRYKNEVRSPQRQGVSVKHALSLVRTLPELDIHHVKLPPGMTVSQALERLKGEHAIETVEPNYVRKFSSTTPNDPQWAAQWALQKVGLPDAWTYSQGSDAIVVAVLDTGVGPHPDLTANLWRNRGEVDCANAVDDDANGKMDDCVGWNFYGGNNHVDDLDGHGTHVAGIVGASGNNGLGVSGVNWRVTIMPVKFMGSDGGTVADEIRGIWYAIRNGAKVINASFGCDPDSPNDCVFSPLEYSAIKAARDAGVLFVAAAGNDSTEVGGAVRHFPSGYGIDNTVGNVTYPALQNVIAVAATDQWDNLAYFSNWGVTGVHVAAPGLDIVSTYLQNGYLTMSGTSMAAPMVSGAAALLWSFKPGASFMEIRDALLFSVNRTASLQDRVATGGRLNVFRSFLALQSAQPVELSVGWNFISLPRQPMDTRIVEVLKNVLPNVKVVWGYDSESKSWLRYSPSSTQNNLTTMEQGKGYWMYLSQQATIDTATWTFRAPRVLLQPGWNLVGYSGQDGALADQTLADVKGPWEIIWSWEENQWSARYNGALSLPIKEMEILRRGRAYWLRLDQQSPAYWIQW